MNSIDQRLVAYVVLVIAFLVASTILYVLGLDAGAMATGVAGAAYATVVGEMLKGKIALEAARRSGLHDRISPEPATPPPQEKPPTNGGVKRARLTPIQRDLADAERREDWTGALALAEALPTEPERRETRERLVKHIERAGIRRRSTER